MGTYNMSRIHKYSLLRRPVITEKSSVLQEDNRYVFEVDPSATKLEIKAAVQDAFNVRVRSINTMIVKGKRKRYGPRMTDQPSWKKAIVTLNPGDSITIFEGV